MIIELAFGLETRHHHLGVDLETRCKVFPSKVLTTRLDNLQHIRNFYNRSRRCDKERF